MSSSFRRAPVFCAVLFPSVSSCLVLGRWSVRPTLTHTPEPGACRNHIGVCLDTTSSEYEQCDTSDGYRYSQ